MAGRGCRWVGVGARFSNTYFECEPHLCSQNQSLKVNSFAKIFD